MTRYMAELAPVPRLLMDEHPPLGTDLWLITKHGTGYRGRYTKPELGDEETIVAWCPLPKLAPIQKVRLREAGIV